jgi:hypothetical protein
VALRFPVGCLEGKSGPRSSGFAVWWGAQFGGAKLPNGKEALAKDLRCLRRSGAPRCRARRAGPRACPLPTDIAILFPRTFRFPYKWLTLGTARHTLDTTRYISAQHHIPLRRLLGHSGASPHHKAPPNLEPGTSMAYSTNIPRRASDASASGSRRPIALGSSSGFVTRTPFSYTGPPVDFANSIRSRVNAA